MLNHKFLFRFIIGVVVAGLFLYLAFKGVEWKVFFSVFLKVNYIYIALTFLILLFSNFFRALRWKYLVKPLKSNSSLIHFFEATMIGYFINNIFPRAGEIMKAYTLSNDEKISSASTLASVFLERVLDIIFSLFFFGIAMLWNKKVFERHYPWLGEVALATSLIIGVVLILVSILLIWREKFAGILSRFLKIFSGKLAEKFESIFSSFVSGFEVLRHRGIYWQVVFLSFSIYICYILSAYFSLFAFDIDRSKIGIFTALVIFVVSTIGFIIPTPGGVGSYHSFITGTLVGLYGVKHEIALGYAVLTHGIGYLMNGLLGFYFVLKKHIKLTIGVLRNGN
jgi:hypothetical protein